MLFRKYTVHILIALIPLSAFAQEQEERAKKEELTQEKLTEIVKNQNVRIDTLQKIVLDLKEKIEKVGKEDEMRKLLEQAQKLTSHKKEEKASLDRKFSSGLRQQSALNPNISMGGDYYIAYGTSQSDYNRLPSEMSWGTGQMFLREMELGLQSALDPFSRGKVFISFFREGVMIEEGYMEFLNLPLKMNLKVGEYKVQFGNLNRYHDHALPQFERPLVLTNFFGTTSLKGFGIAANFQLPSITANVNEFDLELITGGVGNSFTDQGKHNLVLVSHLKNFYDLSRSTYFEFGLSGAYGKNDPTETYSTIVGGADLTFKWSPPDRAKYRSVEWRTEFLYSNRKEPDKTINAWGFFSSIQCRLNARWIFSGRIDYSQLPWNSDLDEKGFAVCFDYWQSEFVFIRFQVTTIFRNFDENDNRFILQTNWAMGPHKHEAY
jgi:hypothetical protein